jgi:hypothetical protein
VRQLAHHRRRLGQNSTAAAARVRLPVNSFFLRGASAWPLNSSTSTGLCDTCE